MNRDFKGVWIPREIWLNDSLSLQAKAVWSEISSLHDRDLGGCYASNEYLCKFLKIGPSRLKENLKELRDQGLIEDISFDGRTRVIRARYPDIDYEKIEENEHVEVRQPENRPAASRHEFCQPENRLSDSLETGSYPYIYNKDSSSKEEEREKHAKRAKPAAKAASPSSSKKKKKEPDRKEVIEGVFLSSQEEISVSELCKGDKDKILWCYKKLFDWKQRKGITRKDHDFAYLQDWAIDAHDDDKRKQNATEEIARVNRTFAEKVWQKAKKLPGGAGISLGSDYIEFYNGVNSESDIYKFSDQEFQKKCTDKLRAKGWIK